MMSEVIVMTSNPIYLVSVNTVPERANNVVGRVKENVKDRYNIVHAGNATCKWSLSFVDQ